MAADEQGVFTRRIAFDILSRVDEGAFADLVLDTALSRRKLDPRDSGLVTELVYGVLRLRGRIDFALEQVSRQPLRRLEAGVVWVNMYRTLSATSPFGGFKNSGLGHENGVDAVREYLQTKSVWISTALQTRDPFVIG